MLLIYPLQSADADLLPLVFTIIAMSNWAVYIVQCSDDSLYTGITTDVTRRVGEHNQDNNKGARYTRARRPVTLVYSEACDNRALASQREYAIKQLTRYQKLALFNNPNT